jgi:hypothetical protein
MAYQNLRFFDSNSDQLNTVWNEELGFYQANVYLPLVSAGLYETCTIFVLEEAVNQLGGSQWVTPISESGNNVKIKFEFDSDYTSSNDIFLFSAKLEGVDTVVNIDKYQEGTLLDPSYSVGTQDGYKIVTSAAKPIPLKAQIALKSEVDSFHIRVLNVYVDSVKYAEFRVYGEIEAEDERLSVLLSNMGMSLDPSDFFIFKDMDVKEGAPDYILLNQKRKELLLQASEIKPFIGTYKALLHVIDFYGYNNLTLKEYWLNVNEQSEGFGKLMAVAVPNQNQVGFLADKNATTELPNSNHKKTSRFSLVYRLNTPTGDYDEWDIPTVQEMSEFSPDEILIKLYGLKNKLQKSYLPLQAKIIDITAEGDYFSQFNQNTWNNQHSIKNQEAGREFESVKVPGEREIFIEDLRKVDWRLTGKDQDFNALAISGDRANVVNSIKNFYTTYYDQNLDTFNTLAGIPIGAPLVLEIEGLEDAWEEALFSWMDAEDTGNHMLTWSNWWHRNVYEIEWVVKGPNYNKSFRGPIEDYIQFPLVLPFAGSYSVEANLWDLYNVKSTKIKKDWIKVNNKSVEIYGLTQLAPKQLTWGEYNYSWSKAGSDWEWSRENLIPIDDIVGTFYLTMDRANYVNDNQYGIQFSTVRRYLDPTQLTGFNETPGPYQWGDLQTQNWEDGSEVTWKMTRIGSDINSSFKMDLRQSTGYMQGYDLVITHTNNVNETITDSYQITNAYPADETDIIAWQAIADELNNLDPKDYPILSKFNWNPILLDQDADPGTGLGPLGEDVCFYILAVSKESSRSYDYDTVSFTDPMGGTITNEIHFTSYNPGFDDTYIFMNAADLHRLNHVTFSYDLTNIPGIISQKWRLINNTLNIQDIYYNNQWFTHLFKDKGFYTVELELTDLNGNKNKVTKNILNII